MCTTPPATAPISSRTQEPGLGTGSDRKTDQQGQLLAIVGVLDHGTHANLLLAAVPNKSTASLLRAVATCVERFGRPQILRTDNEAMFRSKLFRFALWLGGIRHQRIEPHCPWQNGRIERFFGTLKGKLDQWAVEGREELEVSLAIFRLWYNHIRPHQSLPGGTPAEIWAPRARYRRSGRKPVWFEAWDGLLAGEYLPP